MAQYVRYIGTAHRRVISEADWKKAGVDGQAGLSFHAGNAYLQPLEKVGDEALPYIKADKYLVIVGEGTDDRKVDRELSDKEIEKLQKNARMNPVTNVGVRQPNESAEEIISAVEPVDNGDGEFGPDAAAENSGEDQGSIPGASQSTGPSGGATSSSGTGAGTGSSTGAGRSAGASGSADSGGTGSSSGV